MINMKDFLHILRVDGQRISFTDDVPDGRDVTDLITDMRNAIVILGQQTDILHQAVRCPLVECPAKESWLKWVI